MTFQTAPMYQVSGPTTHQGNPYNKAHNMQQPGQWAVRPGPAPTQMFPGGYGQQRAYPSTTTQQPYPLKPPTPYQGATQMGTQGGLTQQGMASQQMTQSQMAQPHQMPSQMPPPQVQSQPQQMPSQMPPPYTPSAAPPPYTVPPQQQMMPQQQQRAAMYGSAGTYAPMSQSTYDQQSQQQQQQMYSELEARNAPVPLVQPTVKRLPANNTTKAKAHLPLALVFQPFAPVDVPVVNMQPKVIRCTKCRSYINPFASFTENGNKWKCNFCNTDNEIPQSYYCPLDAMGERQDKLNRPELMNGAVEFVASPDYMNRPPMAPSYLLVLDITAPSIESGLVSSVCHTFKQIISSDCIPGLERASFGLVTFDSNIQFYNISASQSTPHINVVPGSGEVFLPVSEGIMVDIKENKDTILNLLESLPSFWRTQTSTESNVAAAMQTIKLVLKNTGGRATLVLSSLPTSPELGLNPSHDVRKDAKARTPPGRVADEADGLRQSSSYFSSFASSLAYCQILVDVVAAPAAPISLDLATIAGLARGTGGDLLYYPGYRYQVWGDKLVSELVRIYSRKTGWEGIMRVRMSKGWKITWYSGNYCFRGIDLMMLPSFSEDSTVVLELDNAESVTSESVCYAQLALLYSTSDGERRIRCLTVALPTTNNVRDMVMAVDCSAMTHLIAAKAMEEGFKAKLANSRSYISTVVGNVIQSLMAGGHQPIPPAADVSYPLDETNPIQMLTLMSVGMVKSPCFREGKDISPDQRVYYWHRLRGLPVPTAMAFFKPFVFDIVNLAATTGVKDDSGVVRMPIPIRATQRAMSSECAYMACDGETIYIWIGKSVNAEWLRQIFGVVSLDQLIPEWSGNAIGTSGTPMTQRVYAVVQSLREAYPTNFLKIFICKQGDPLEYKFMQCLTEDKSHVTGMGFLEQWQKYTMSGRHHMGAMHMQ
eukprot:Blabericola_migrator_1__3592@NODE_206_length_11426_cov_120_443789_g177_i0_p2_GENE_NODE_206_length_11426_cov_120_443789_g177_i0NODE_206_length_11426_cov_120_443789_g177_i0_p2_ORF_typecomplete_len935_score166_79Sec23_trunk/PF04811_15/1_1e39Sec23_BS/PF08033_12/1_1e04Sec23_BS/PF08033_12/6_3e16zfSec23_Sec24/PF04810_15/3_5e14Sec23_helical/PF04815_15/1_7e09Gelsolin/PF00626_22/7_8e03Gelsolin/PF00626_22/0_012CDC24_OB3/PF17244_2/0_087MRNIP/PF15749_5/2_2e03MRNIP/PF15749_5/0_21_NODE_206_length_11426_cov_120